ncbi:phosphoribosyltransferase family protein [Paenarthrobacter nitroguajacolicus]|uniref:ComF family protein n=1 Tax=Paenarthrobacter nitroguajacolicus TaxID=211146 RepID=UPI00285EDF81|nr:phosphoribosyltransferase family protein [Paenarthrobacter nitroguajacolicus]MDR6637881.1 putative amidophosphoribosyltransferase [Paenarthrobacter nitroguajacolicus]
MTSFPPTPKAARRRRREDPDLRAPVTGRARRRGLDRQPIGRLLFALQKTLAELLALLVPVECVCCNAEDTVLCGSCAKRVRQLCREPFRAEQEAPALVDVDGTAKIGVVAAGPYRDELAQCLLSFKHYGQWRLAGVLAHCLGKAVDSATGGQQGYRLVPVPTSASAFAKRGFSPVHLLLLWMRLRRMHPQCPALDALVKTARPIRHGLSRFSPGNPAAWFANVVLGRDAGNDQGGQKGLGRGGRASRVRGSMRVRHRWSKELKGARCILIDDVLTTGATLAEAARAVTAAGGVVCGAVVLAATRPPAYASVVTGDDPRVVDKTKSKNKRLKDE